MSEEMEFPGNLWTWQSRLLGLSEEMLGIPREFMDMSEEIQEFLGNLWTWQSRLLGLSDEILGI